MRRELTLHVPGLLGPWPAPLAGEITRGLEAGGLGRILSRARRIRRPARTAAREPYERLAFAVFGFSAEGGDAPAAAISWESDTAAPGGSGAEEHAGPACPPRIRADPVHIRADLQAARLFDAAHFELSTDEAAAMIESLNRHFESQGLRFKAPHPTRWYAWTKDAPAAFHPPCAVAGHDAGDRLPYGREGSVWRRRMTEAQMVLHDLDVNRKREAGGKLPVNSVWFWGAGDPPRAPARPFDEVWTDDPLVRALALRCGAPVRGLPDEASEAGLPAGRGLIAPGSGLYRAVVSRDVEAWRRGLLAAEKRWLSPLSGGSPTAGFAACGSTRGFARGRRSTRRAGGGRAGGAVPAARLRT